LELRHPFARYVFVEQRRDDVAALYDLKSQFPALADRVDIRRGDANRQISEFCEVTDWNVSRCVMFLDPFGNQVEWRTLEVIARTRSIDVWYLFPAGLGVHRQISREGTVADDHAASLDKIIGDPRWREVFVSVKPVEGLFETMEERRKIADAEAVTRYMAERMKTIFAGGVLDEWLPLGRNRAHHYSLMFAWGNPSSKASELARKFARDVLKK
jgi:three-Cys-motif partner protein